MFLNMKVIIIANQTDSVEKRKHDWLRFPEVVVEVMSSIDDVSTDIDSSAERKTILDLRGNLSFQTILPFIFSEIPMVVNTQQLTANNVHNMVTERSDRLTYFFNPIIFCPSLLELKKAWRENSFGEFRSAELTVFLENNLVFSQLIEALFWLFDPPSICRVDHINERTFRILMSVTRGAAPWAVSLTCIFGTRHPLFQTEEVFLPQGEFFFEKATVSLSASVAPHLSVTPNHGKSYVLVLPEGGGVYYNVLDVFEKWGEGRLSSILPPSIVLTLLRLRDQLVEQITLTCSNSKWRLGDLKM